MKRMLAGLVAITIAITSMAQDTDSKHEKGFGGHGRRLDKEKMEQLNLSAEQKAQLQATKEDFRKQMQELKGNTGMTEEQKASKRKEIIESEKAKMKAILTPEQQEKAKELRKEAHEQRKEAGEGRKERFEKMQKDLNLSAEQSTKIKAINEKFKTNLQAIKNNTSLTQEQKKEQMKTLFESHKSDIKAVLTAEQQAKMKAEFKGRREEKGDK